MKLSIPISILFVAGALFFSGCGGSDAAPASGEEARQPPARSTGSTGKDAPRVVIGFRPNDPRFATISGGASSRAKPKLDPPDRPVPKNLLIRNIEVGSGPMARRGDRVGVEYVGVDYRTGRERYYSWPPTKDPLVFQLGRGGFGDAWEGGIEGMRLGGRRELIVPSRLLFNSGTVDYVIDLVRVGPVSEPSSGG
jgi:peptidylprolyl isomerase